MVKGFSNEETKKKRRITIRVIEVIIFLIVLFLLVGGGIYCINRYSNSEIRKSETVVIEAGESKIINLDIDVRAVDLYIKYGGDVISLKHHDYINYNIKDDTLVIKEKKRKWYERVDGKVTLTIPSKYKFNKVTIENDAGRVNMSDLTINDLDLEVDAGVIELNDLNVLNSFSLENKSGKTKINNGYYNNSNMDLAVGKIDILADLDGKNIIKTGVGTAKIKLIGNSDKYKVTVTKGLGDVIVGNYLAKDKDVYGHGAIEVSLVGGVGNSVLKFTDTEGNIIEDIYR